MTELREKAHAGADATLEDLFIRAVGASVEETGGLSWLQES